MNRPRSVYGTADKSTQVAHWDLQVFGDTVYALVSMFLNTTCCSVFYRFSAIGVCFETPFKAVTIVQSWSCYNVNNGFRGFICKITLYTPSVAYLNMTRLDDRGQLFVRTCRKVLSENDMGCSLMLWAEFL